MAAYAGSAFQSNIHYRGLEAVAGMLVVASHAKLSAHASVVGISGTGLVEPVLS